MLKLPLRFAGPLAFLLFAGTPEPGLAQSCKSDGGLAYLGNTKDQSQSVWLSATVAGSFSLEAAQGNTTVDTWDKTKRGLHVSTSPFVSSGNGGTHRLFNMEDPGSPCLIDTQNQQRGFKIPPNISFPSVTLPGTVLPPIGNFFPDFAPPIGTLPPGGVMPGLPGGIQPPIGTVPPSGVMPGVPGAVTPPIGTLPPEGVTPGVPGGVQPPIGTLPPDGVTPGGPGGAKPPAAGQRIARYGTDRYGRRCIDPRSPRTAADGTRIDLPLCPPEVPLTEGRDLTPPTLWNAWAEGRLVGVSDERYDLDMDTVLGTATVGIDRRLSDDVVLGVSFSLEDSETDGFGDFLKADTTGFNIGPYIAVRLSPNWAIDASLAYGQYDNDIELSVLSGNYTSHRYSGTVTLHGQYKVDEYFVRPKASVTYSHITSDGYDMEGDVLGLPIAVRFPEDSFDYGAIEAATEFSRFFSLPDGAYVMPFLELGGRYEFERPNGGEILTGDLSLATPSPWTATVRSGFRMLIAESVQLEAAAGYLSFGQSGLDVWEGKLRLSYGF